MVAPRMSAPPPARSAWKIVALVLFVLLGISFLANIVLSLGSVQFAASTGHGRSAGASRLLESVLEDNDSRNKIAVIDIAGMISSDAVGPSGESLVDHIRSQLERAAEDDHVKAVLLRVDSPGGEVLASDEIYRLIQHFQTAEHSGGKPVIASMGSLAASGGYYVSAPCRWIVANELTITGSIGVIRSGYTWRGLMDKVGVRPRSFKSGKFKDMLSGERNKTEIPEDERALIDGWINETYVKFKGIVSEGRKAAAEQNDDKGKKLVENWEEFCDGRIFTGREALKLGFVDGLGNFDDAIKKTKELAKVKHANLIEYRTRHDLSDILGIFGSAESRKVKLDLGVEFPKLEAGRAYFLYLP